MDLNLYKLSWYAESYKKLIALKFLYSVGGRHILPESVQMKFLKFNIN